MADFGATAEVTAGGCVLNWSLVFDDSANTVTLEATHTLRDGSTAAVPRQALVTFTLNNGQSIAVDLVTGLLDNGQAFDGTASMILNSGPRIRTNVRLRLSADRAQAIVYRTDYIAP